MKNTNILVTAGSTWVPIDKVRVITNIFGGKLGIMIANEAEKKGFNVTLLLGPSPLNINTDPTSKLKVIRYKYYNELLDLMKTQLKSCSYSAVVHSAAVADYAPVAVKKGKIKSGIVDLIIHLRPTIKIADLIKQICPKVFLVKFKLEVGVSKTDLIDIAYKSMLQSNADLIVANDFNDLLDSYKAYVIDRNKNYEVYETKEVVAREIIKRLHFLVNK